MGFKNFIRTLVVRTNPFPPFKQLNRLPYAMAIRRVIRLAESLPGIQSVYLRHGLTRPNWEPGLSDIDFTVVVSSKLSPEDEFKSVQKFMGAYRSLKRWFPMLGEVDIFSEAWCCAWSRFSIRGFEIPDWKLLHGTETVKSAYAGNETRIRRDKLDHACYICELFILERFHGLRFDEWIESRELVRIAQKTLWYAHGAPVWDTQGKGVLYGNAAATLLRVLESLDIQVRESFQQFPQDLAPAGRAPAIPEAADRPGYSADKFEFLRQYDSIILSVILSYSTSFIVLKDGLSLGAVEEELEGIRKLCRATGIRPHIVTRNLFQYYMQFYQPRMFLELQEYRHILFGVDLLREIDAPGNQSLARELLSQSFNSMLAPARYAGHQPSAMRKTDWVVDAWRSTFLLLYLDTGVVDSYARSVNACRERYPELCDEIMRLANPGDDMDNAKLAHSVHALLRRYALDINQRLERLATDHRASARNRDAQTCEDSV